MLRFLCLRCKTVAETGDNDRAARWLEAKETLPCGHRDADFLPNPVLVAPPVPLGRPTSRTT
ncbi:MAG: hypothetical protein ABR562_04170 [Thermoplasmatota archaeon]|nr:hypothetical protein [Halobacteriales archaeon]